MKNVFKAALQSGSPQIGFWLSLANAYTAEICATAGFDWLLIDGEHAPNDVRSVVPQLQAIAAYPSQPVVRPVTGDVALIKQYLDIGAQSLLIPMVDTAEQAARMVAAVRYPPQGIRGSGAGGARASRWGLHRDYINRANDEICLLVQAESTLALANLEAICAVDGVDGVFIGPSDLAASLGYRGDPGHPEVCRVIDDALQRIIRNGKAAGILTSDNAQAKRYIDMGCRFVAVGVDASILARTVRELARQFNPGNAAGKNGPAAGSVY